MFNMKKSFIKGFNTIKKNPKNIFYAIIIDLLFFTFYGFIVNAYNSKIYQYLNAIGTVAISAKGIDATEPSFFSIIFNEHTYGYFIFIILLLVLLALSVYFIYCFFFGITTYISFNLDKFRLNDLFKDKAKSFIKKFFKINVSWFLLFSLYQFIGFYLSYINTARETLGVEKANFSIFGSIIVLLFFYLIILSYVLPGKNNFRKTIKIAISKYKKALPLYLVLVGLFIIINYVSLFFIKMNNVAGILFVMIMVPGFLIFVRYVFKVHLLDNKIVKEDDIYG